jgi:hypothetical protein
MAVQKRSVATLVPNKQRAPKHLLVVSDGKVSSADIGHKSVVSGNLDVHTSIPNSEGFYKLESSGVLQLAQVIESYGTFVCKLLDGSRCASLSKGQLLHGPFDLSTDQIETHTVELSSLIPNDSVEIESLEEELNKAYITISSLEKQNALVDDSSIEKKLRKELAASKEANVTLSEKISNYNQTINVQSDELSVAENTIKKLIEDVEVLNLKLVSESISVAEPKDVISSEQKQELLLFILSAKQVSLGNRVALTYLEGLQAIIK